MAPLATGGDEAPETADRGAEVAAVSPGGPEAIAPAGAAGGGLAVARPVIAGPAIAGPAGGGWLSAAPVTGPVAAAGLVPAGTTLVGVTIDWAAGVSSVIVVGSGVGTWPAEVAFALVGAVAGAACKPACVP
ncbi:MAG: hypothetical protein ACREEU_04260 [Acetobacteraceae bacterium]